MAIRIPHVLAVASMGFLCGALIGACMTTPSSSSGTTDGGTTDGGTTDGGTAACDALWSKVTQLYSDATSLTSCSGIAAAQPIVSSLMNVNGLSINNNGTTMYPCLETMCDSTYVYVATNSLPHYDFVATTPNALQVSDAIYRIPMTPSPVGVQADAGNAATETSGCQTAYNDYVSGTAATTEPSGLSGTGYLYDDLADGGDDYYEKIPSLNSTGFMISGPPTFGPNEATVPDPFGNPAYYWPSVAGETYGGSMSAALDLCGGHTSPSTMHYHGVNEACFERTDAGTPANSYVAATEDWNFESLIDATCTAESGIVGWSFDGYPIKGPCICTSRNGDGSCATLARARSSWEYGGLKIYGSSSLLSAEGTSCTTTAECCSGVTGTCKYECSWAVLPDAGAAGGTSVNQSCVLLDYSWCANQYVDRSEQDVSATNYVYLDRCNGYQTADGYAYYTTGSFPFIQGCYHGTPSDTVTSGGELGGGSMMGPPGGGP